MSGKKSQANAIAASAMSIAHRQMLKCAFNFQEAGPSEVPSRKAESYTAGEGHLATGGFGGSLRIQNLCFLINVDVMKL